MLRSSAFRTLGAFAAIALGTSMLAACNHNPPGVPNGADPEKVARAEYDLAQDEWRHGRLRSAMEHAIRASDADETYAEADHFVAILYLALCQIEGDCRFDEAETYARKAVAADAEYRPAKHTLGVILVEEKKYDEAIKILQPLAEDIIYKTPELAWYDLGGAYLGKGDADHAIDALSKAIALRPSFCWADYRLGLAYEKKGVLKLAIDELSKAVEPPDPACRNLQDAYFARGRVWMRMGKKTDARGDFMTCVKLAPETDAGKSCSKSL
jgi:tetratricopeptide (TPR) repeat protein